MIVQYWHPRGWIVLSNGTKIKYHLTRSPFADIAPACGSYQVTAYDDDSITIVHDDAALSGTYDLKNDISMFQQAIPHLIVIRDLHGWSDAQTKQWGKALKALIEIVTGDDDD